jgi:hypothetical protein
MLRRAVVTRWVGEWMKCFAGGVLVSRRSNRNEGDALTRHLDGLAVLGRIEKEWAEMKAQRVNFTPSVGPLLTKTSCRRGRESGPGGDAPHHLGLL